MERGYYRIHLAAIDDKDWMTLYVPLTKDGQCDPAAPKPYLLKCLWNQEEWLGEFIVEYTRGNKYNKIQWLNSRCGDYVTDLLTTPIKLASQCYVYEGDSSSADKFAFQVRGMIKL